MKQSFNHLKITGVLMMMAVTSCHNVAKVGLNQQSGSQNNALELLLSSKITSKADNGNVVFSLLDRDSGEYSEYNLWFYIPASNKLGKIPFSNVPTRFDLSKNGRFVVYLDGRHEIDGIGVHDGLLVYDIENECLLDRIGIGDNYTTFKFLGDILEYTIDTGIYLYDPAFRKTDDVESPFLTGSLLSDLNDSPDKFGWPENFALSPDGNYLAEAQSINYGDYRELVLYKKGHDKHITYETVQLPYNHSVYSVEFNPGSNVVGICYNDVDSLTTVDIFDKSIRNIKTQSDGGLITWESDSVIRVDYPYYSEKIRLK